LKALQDPAQGARVVRALRVDIDEQRRDDLLRVGRKDRAMAGLKSVRETCADGMAIVAKRPVSIGSLTSITTPVKQIYSNGWRSCIGKRRRALLRQPCKGRAGKQNRVPLTVFSA
jgi:hypothetical protein